MFDRHLAVNAKDARAASFPRVRHSQVLHVVLSQSWKGSRAWLAPACPSHLHGVSDTPYASRDSTPALPKGKRVGLSRLFELPADVLSASESLLGTITFPSCPGGGKECLFFYSSSAWASFFKKCDFIVSFFNETLLFFSISSFSG